MANPSYASWGPEKVKVQNYSSVRRVVMQYFRAKKGFFLDLCHSSPPPGNVMGSDSFAIRERGNHRGDDNDVDNVPLPVSPKNLSLSFLRGMQNLSGYIFCTAWFGGELVNCLLRRSPCSRCMCWYLLGIQRAAKCLRVVCRKTQGCGLRTLACEETIYYGSIIVRDPQRLVWGDNKHVRWKCIESSSNFDYGGYKWTVALVTNNNSRLEKIIFPIF